MLDRIKDILKFSAKNGLYFPAAYDKASNGPSVSLLFSHISFWVTTFAIIYLIIKDIESGVIAATVQSALMLVFYLLRRLSKVKFDLDDKAIELDSEPSSKVEK